MRGVLALVVGPSGSGKDTLLAGAAARLAADGRFVFARRVVTRPAEHEDHESIDVPGFLARRARGDFALHWEAHGLYYGIPEAALAPLETGAVVVANVSRGVIVEAARRYPVAVVEITAPEALRARRLVDRAREDAPAIAERLTRQVTPPSGIRLHSVVNDRSIEAGVSKLAALLHLLAEERQAVC